MKSMSFKILSAGWVFIVLLSGTSCLSQSHQQDPARNGLSRDVDVSTFSQLIHQKEDVQILDVRTPEEWAAGIIPGAKKMNLHDPDFTTQLQALDKERPVLVYCRSGARSANAMKQMINMGFKEVYNLEGGILAWQTAQQPVSR